MQRSYKAYFWNVTYSTMSSYEFVTEAYDFDDPQTPTEIAEDELACSRLIQPRDEIILAALVLIDPVPVDLVAFITRDCSQTPT